jgi:hypothetical protein
LLNSSPGQKSQLLLSNQIQKVWALFINDKVEKVFYDENHLVMWLGLNNSNEKVNSINE